MRPWVEPAPVVVPPALAAAVGGHPIVAEALVRRGITDPEQARAFLNPSLYTASSPLNLPGMGRAVTRLGRAIRAHEPVCIWGDFDVDGQTSTALLVSVLRDLGAEASYHVPLRENEGHGVSLPVLEQVIDGGARVILTCDTGIAAHEAVVYARSRGVDFVITDHHDLPEQLPEAAAVINPKLLAERPDRFGKPVRSMRPATPSPTAAPSRETAERPARDRADRRREHSGWTGRDREKIGRAHV